MLSKCYLIFGMLFFFSNINYSQGSISGISISPTNPTINDTITVYADLTFSNSSCDFFNSSQTIIGNNINITTQHCYGMLTSLCFTTDTFTIAPLSSGNYILDLTLTSDINYGIVPCNGGVSPDDNDTFQFEVIDPTSTQTILSGKDYSIYPNPSNGFFNYEQLIDYHEIMVYSTKGKEVFSKTIAGTKGQFELLVDPGVYYVKLKTENGRESAVKKILIIE